MKNCPYCKAHGKFYFNISSKTYNRCSGCGLIYKESHDSYDKVVVHYRDDCFSRYSADQMSGERDRLFGRILDLIEKRRDTGRILDIGAGCGFFLVAAQKRGWEVKGIEPSTIETWGTSIGILVDNGLRLFYRDFMPRKSRIDAPGALHHIIVRGIERRKIFYDDSDRDNFLKRLGVVLSDTKTPCFAWALIPNHLHLLLRTGVAPIATVMRRLLTGYAVNFNHRHRRHGQLFQNRYKSILCQEDQYLLELVRYIHLNPLRAGLISDLKELDKHPYCGHSVLMGKKKHDWQDTNYILKFYDSKYAIARRRYRDYVKKGIPEGRRPDLVGGGLIRSAGGWSIVKALRKSAARMKGDERILGDGNFVEKVLRESKENFERKHRFESKGYDFDWLVKQVADLLDIEPRDVLARGKYKQTVKARGLLCYWGTRELGMTTVELAKKLNLAQPTISQSAMRGQKVAAEEGLKLLKQIK